MNYSCHPKPAYLGYLGHNPGINSGMLMFTVMLDSFSVMMKTIICKNFKPLDIFPICCSGNVKEI